MKAAPMKGAFKNVILKNNKNVIQKSFYDILIAGNRGWKIKIKGSRRGYSVKNGENREEKIEILGNQKPY